MTGLIAAIAWERVNLTLTVTLAGRSGASGGVQFKIVDGDRSFPVKTTPVADGQYRLEINVTNFHNRRQVPDGTWRIVPFVGDEPGPAIGYDLNALEQLDQDSRTFLYAGNSTAYVVGFGVSEDDGRPDFLMRTYQMFRQPKRKPRLPRLAIGRRARQWLIPRVYRLARLINPPRGNRILFASEMRTGMEGNLARVHERMVERGLASRYKFRYSFRVPRIATKQTTLRTIYLVATSDIVLIDDYFALLEALTVGPKTKIIQLWHAGSGFKAVGFSRFGTYGSPKLQNAHRKYTYAIAGSTHLVPVYAEAFGIEESAVIPTGLPRVDTFLNTERTKKVVADFFATYPHLAGKKVILFAPTFRGRSIHDAYYDYSRIDFGKLYEVCGTNAVVLFRMHHFVRSRVPIPSQYADRLFDFGTFPSTNDLLQVADVLITDYSSVIYEYSLLRRPMLFFAYDKEVYGAARGFHRDLETAAPGKVCQTFDELIKALQTEDYETWKIEGYLRENFDWIDTGAADRVIDWLILGTPPANTGAEAVPAQRELPEPEAAHGDHDQQPVGVLEP